MSHTSACLRVYVVNENKHHFQSLLENLRTGFSVKEYFNFIENLGVTVGCAISSLIND